MQPKPPIQPGDIWEGSTNGLRTRRQIVAIEGRDVQLVVELIVCSWLGVILACFVWLAFDKDMEV